MLRGDRSKRTETIAAASFCVLAVLGSIALLYALGILNGREAERRQQAPASYSQAAKADAQRACAGTEVGAQFECVYERVEASQEQARGEQDLSAQQRAASAALASAVVALLTLVISGIGVWFVKRTLDATLKAVEDTGLATAAMVRQNEIAERGQRPWLSVTLHKLGPVERRSRGVFYVHYVMDVKNTGALPAVIVGETVGIEKADESQKISAKAFVDEAYSLISMKASAIAPNSTERFASSTLVDMGEISDEGLRPNGTIPCFWLGVAYQDGETSKIYYTLQIAHPLDARVENGDAPAVFDIRGVVTKTLMGAV